MDVGVLTVVVAALVALVLRRVVVLRRDWHTARGFATGMLVVCVALLVTAGGFELKHQWVQARATALVVHVSGSREAQADCQRFTPELVDLSVTSGFVFSDSQNVAHLRRTVCNDLYAWLLSSKRAPTDGQVRALHITVHEAMHVRGEFNEARAECFAMQQDADAARFLGASRTQATALAERYYRDVYPRMSAEYVSGDCAADRALDLTPGDGQFP
ncbi:hypothetical protein DDP54_16450 (plasmid) [Cellulomonas sp. WB94]|uniref:hypothetical protein n=1 Tax=Cellulomonas sp. WB94 TaxID=2173174 RepID=UPI000D584714|nr:hypothetical protein [Cellulomonas sp. WB94]PVU81466.1 hypothetical protein DDP54_16450 [Cellulomonas sp. WB94]